MKTRQTLSPLTLARTPLGLWMVALAVGVSPIAQSALSEAPSDALTSLIALTRDHRLVLARQYEDRGPLTVLPGDAPDQLTRALSQLRIQTTGQPESVRSKVRHIELRWHVLIQAIQRGELSSAQSFAAHSALLDAQLELRASLSDAPH